VDVRDGFPSDEDDEVDNAVVRDVPGKLGHFLEFELRQCAGLQTHNAVMESFLENPLVQPHLPPYYLLSTEVRAQMLIISNLQRQLELVKGVHSTEKLQYRGVILDAAVSGNLEGHNVAVFRLLGTKASNIKMALERRTVLHSEGLSVFKFRAQKKRADVLPPATVILDVEWWTNEMRISPVSKDTVRDRVARNEYNHHPTYLLQETLVIS
jgi:hypothetical protein